MRCHFLGVLERAAAGEVDGDSGGAVARDVWQPIGDALPGRGRPPSDHPASGRLGHRVVGQHFAVVSSRRAEQPALTVVGDARRVDIGARRPGERVISGFSAPGSGLASLLSGK
jgi:hypothetical protein